MIRHKLVDMALRVETARSFVYDWPGGCSRAWARRRRWWRTCMGKVVATQAMQFCADRAVQILGGMGYARRRASASTARSRS